MKSITQIIPQIHNLEKVLSNNRLTLFIRQIQSSKDPNDISLIHQVNALRKVRFDKMFDWKPQIKHLIINLPFVDPATKKATPYGKEVFNNCLEFQEYYNNNPQQGAQDLNLLLTKLSFSVNDVSPVPLTLAQLYLDKQLSSNLDVSHLKPLTIQFKISQQLSSTPLLDKRIVNIIQESLLNDFFSDSEEKIVKTLIPKKNSFEIIQRQTKKIFYQQYKYAGKTKKRIQTRFGTETIKRYLDGKEQLMVFYSSFENQLTDQLMYQNWKKIRVLNNQCKKQKIQSEPSQSSSDDDSTKASSIQINIEEKRVQIQDTEENQNQNQKTIINQSFPKEKYFFSSQFKKIDDQKPFIKSKNNSSNFQKETILQITEHFYKKIETFEQQQFNQKGKFELLFEESTQIKEQNLYIDRIKNFEKRKLKKFERIIERIIHQIENFKKLLNNYYKIDNLIKNLLINKKQNIKLIKLKEFLPQIHISQPYQPDFLEYLQSFSTKSLNQKKQLLDYQKKYHLLKKIRPFIVPSFNFFYQRNLIIQQRKELLNNQICLIIQNKYDQQLSIP